MILLFLEIMTQRIELFFEETYMTLRIELFSQNLRIDPFLQIWFTPRIQAFWTFSYDSKNCTVSWIWLQELDLFQNDSKNWTFSSKWLKNFVLWIWLRIDFFDYDSQKGIVLFTLTLTIEPFSKYDPKDWTFLIDWLIWSKGLFFLWWVTESNTFLNTKELNLLLFLRRKELNHFFFWRLNWTLFRSKELNILFEYDSQNWTLFWNVTQRIEPDFQKIDSKNWSLFTRRLKELNPLHKMTQRIEPFFLKVWPSTIEPFEKYDSKDWTLLFNMTQRIEPSFHKWLEDLNFLLQICLIESNFFLKKKKKRWLQELIFWKYQSKYRNFILMTQRIELFFLKNMTHGTEPFFHVTHGIEPFFPTWLIVIESFFFDMTQRIEPFLEYDSKSWKFFMNFWLKELNLFWIWLENLNFSWMWLTELNFLTRIEFFSVWQRFCWIRLKESNLFLKICSKNFFFSVWFSELNLFFSITYRMEHLRERLKELNFYCNKTWHKELNFLWN